MEQRTRFALDYKDGLFSIAELCERYGVSRKTGYKWIRRYNHGGLDGLEELSRRPDSCPHQTPEPIERLIVQCRKKHPFWGPEKLLDYLSPRHPQLDFPAKSTVGAIVARHGLVKRRNRKRPTRHPGAAALTTTEPNQIWSADFKGQFKMRNGVYNYPLTITDSHSRLILCCKGLRTTEQITTEPEFIRLFRTHGLPDAIRTDNGNPFATRALCGLSTLSVLWIKLGITHQRIEPGCPQQNGRHERMHRDLKAQTTRPPASDFGGQQKRFDAFMKEFNNERPHAALGGMTPASCYTTSTRRWPSSLPEPNYPAHFETRWVALSGTFKWKNHQLFISQVLGHEWIALEEIDDGVWSIYYYDVLLARLDERDFKLKAAVP
jgi:transposase InsO family protein